MKEEIKEILDELRDKDCYINNETTLTFDEAKDILDYITNLQEKYNEYKQRNEKAIDYIYKLQKDEDIEIWRENGYWAYLLNILKGDKNE